MTDDVVEYTDVFHFDEDKVSFEDYAESNGMRFWHARALMVFLGYESYTSFTNAINRAILACTALNIPIMDNFINCTVTINGKEHSYFSGEQVIIAHPQQKLKIIASYHGE